MQVQILHVHPLAYWCMQIDTHNRKYNITEQVGYRPWFLPKVQQNNMTQLNGGLSPLIECPCSDRITRSTEETSQLLTSGTCGSPITSAGECAQAVSSIANVSSSVTVNDGAQPAGCQMVPDEHQLGVYKTVFNAAKSAVECGDRGPFSWVGPTNASAIDCTNGACLKSDL